MLIGFEYIVVFEFCFFEEEFNGVIELLIICCDMEGFFLWIILCVKGGGVLLSVKGMVCFECGKMLCSSIVIKRMLVVFSFDVL